MEEALHVPIEIEKKIFLYLNLKCLKNMKNANKYYKKVLDKEIKLIAINKIKKFFKSIKLPYNIEEMYDDEEVEAKISAKEWVKIYYFYYPKNCLQSELNLLVRKIGAFFGEHRSYDIQKIVDECSCLSTRYKLVNCLKNMSKDEIEAVGW